MKRLWTLTAAIALLGMLFIPLLLSTPTLASAALTNAAMLALRDGLMAQDNLALGTYPHYNALPEDLNSPFNIRYSSFITRHSPFAIHPWALGRAALAVGDAETAADALQPLITQAERKPLLYDDVMTALSRGGEPEDVLALYEAASPPKPTQVVSDTVALAYLEQRGIRDGWLERAKELRPGDLYLNYHLWKQAREAGDVRAAAAYSETLTYFPLEAVDPTDERLLAYAAQVIPKLLEEGVWDREKTLNVVSYLVWQHNTAEGVVRLLEDLTARYPTAPDWPFYLAELYHRRGDLDQAETVYEQVLEVDPEYAQAYLRLGMVSEAASERGGESADQRLSEPVLSNVEGAARWYAQYNALAPDDLLGLKRLTETCATLAEAGIEDESCRDTAALREELEAKTDDRRVVAELLDVPVEDVELGPNLVQNGGFEEWLDERPLGWKWHDMAEGNSRNKGLFVGEANSLGAYSSQAARVEGLWLQHCEGKNQGRSGYLHWDEKQDDRRFISLRVGSPYLLSFYYRTERLADSAAKIWLIDDPVVFAHSRGLLASNGAWFHFITIVWNRSDAEAAICPLVRSFAAGRVEFDDVAVRLIVLAEGNIAKPNEID